MHSSTVRAQSEAVLATRRLALQEAERAAAAGDHQRALDLAERAVAMQSRPSVRAFIAEQYVFLGRPANAFGAADQCIAEARRDTANPDSVRLVQRCTDIVNRIQREAGTVVVQLPAGAPASTVVHIGSEQIDPSAVGLPHLVAPGTVPVVVEAPGFVPYRSTASVVAGRLQRVDVVLVELPREPVAGSGPVPAVGARASVPSPAVSVAMPPPVVLHRGISSHAAAGVGTLVAGLAVAGGGIAAHVLNVGATDSFRNAMSGCDGARIDRGADPRCAGWFDLANTTAPLAIAGYAVGGALVVTGAVLLATSGRASHERTTASVVCTPGLTTATVVCGGEF